MIQNIEKGGVFPLVDSLLNLCLCMQFLNLESRIYEYTLSLLVYYVFESQCYMCCLSMCCIGNQLVLAVWCVGYSCKTYM